eukprot:TRINITY_DN5187_c0_g6_i1.p1 TRINITY_DN5187_c0_g6~~TRINITY_DN5187_c0_g6_i1.p1  ORF type:complete len:169 (+),score=23.21 TRINITY_DN5187_c0_g6_i1:87-593(+)
MNVFQEKWSDLGKFGHSATRAKTQPSNFEEHAEAHDADNVLTCCSALEVFDDCVDDEPSKDPEDPGTAQQLECKGCDGMKGTRTQCAVRACWSVGSAGHGAGRCCKPCPYVRLGKECFDGQNCMMCHLDHTLDHAESIKRALAMVKSRPVARDRCACDVVKLMSRISL